MIVDLVSAAQKEDWLRARELLYQHWIAECPKLYASNPEHPWEGLVDDQTRNASLFTPLAGALCADSSVTDSNLTPLNQQAGINPESSKAGQICGHVFKSGELTYTCKDCATDPTCVMCRECFQKSEHKNHKYKMHSSTGSGYCDCGDADAWKTAYACTEHAPNSDSEPVTTPDLPPGLHTRLRELLTVVLQYCNNLVCWDDRESLPDFLKNVNDSDKDTLSSVHPFMTVLYNDETHTYENVIRALEMFVHCNKEQAMLIATIVDREGRSSVKVGSKQECERIKAEVQRRTSRELNRRTEKSGPLDVKVMECELVAHQNHAIALLSWLNHQLELFPSLSDLVGDILLNADALPSPHASDMLDTDGDPVSLLVRFLRWDKHMWKSARNNLHQILMKTVLMNIDQKFLFAKTFLQNYDTIYADFIEDDHELEVSIVSLSVQFLTVPGIARRLIAEEDAMRKIFKALMVHTTGYKKEVEGQSIMHFDFASRSFPAVLKRAMHMMRDQVYMLNAVPHAGQWTEDLRHNFVNGFEELIVFLHCMQGMDEVKRQSMEHQVWELEWETAFNIQLRIQEILGLVIQWASTDRWVHRKVMVCCLDALKLHPVVREGENGATHTEVVVNDNRAFCSCFDVLHGSVSIHQQLWRLTAGLFAVGAELTQFLQKDGIVESEEEKYIVAAITTMGKDIYENPLRVSVLCAQTTAQLWRRNGFSLINQIHNYYSPLCRTEMFDRDLLMLQVGAALFKPVDFLLHMLYRFRLAQWADLNFDGTNRAPTDRLSGGNDQVRIGATRQQTPFGKMEPEETSKIIVTLAEDMMHLLILICGERYKPGVGQCTLEDHLRREVIHILCMGPHPFSQIVKKMPTDPQLEKISLHDVVNTVADFKKPASTSAGQFHLKKSLLREYNPFFYHYSKSDLSQAELYQQKLRAKLDKSMIACPPPVACPFLPFFKPIRNLLNSEVMVRLCRAILERTARRNRFSSDRLLHRALYLISMGLQEQEIDLQGFGYVQVAEKENILTLMQNLAASNEGSMHADLLSWTIQKFVEVSRLSKDSASQPQESAESTKVLDDVADSKTKRAQIAAKMRAQAMQKMQKMQSSFIGKMETEGVTTETPAPPDGEAKLPIGVDDDEDYVTMLPESGFPVCIGANRSRLESIAARKVTCMLCQEEETLTPGQGKPFVCAAYVQKSLLFAQKYADEPNARYFRGDFVPAALHSGTDASTCSHTMHYECYQSLSETLLTRERQRPRQQMMFNQKMVDPESGEYLCPLCKRLSNTAMPVLPPIPLMGIDGFTSMRSSVNEEFDDWVSRVKELLEAPTRPAPQKSKSHSRKRSHSERSLMDLAKQEDELSNMALDNNFSTSVPSASTMSLLMGGATKDGRRSTVRSTSQVNTTSDTGSADLAAENRQLIIELEALIAADVGAAGSGTPTSPSSSVALDETRRERRSDSTKNFSFPQSITGLLKGMPGIASILKIHRMISPAYERYEEMIRSFSKCLAQTRERRAAEDKNKELFEENMRGYLCALATWHSTAHVLRSTTAVLHNDKKPLFGALNTRQRDCLVAMSRLCATLSFSMQHIPEHTALTLRALLSPPPATVPPGPTSPKSPDCASSPLQNYPTSPASSSSLPDSATTPLKLLSSPIVQFLFSTHSKLTSQGAAVNILHIDMLSLAVSLSMSIGWTWQDGVQSMRHPKKERELLPDGSIDEQHCVRLCLLGHYFQVVASFKDDDTPPTTMMDDQLHARVCELWTSARPHDPPLTNVHGLAERLHLATLCFLRPMALFYNAITMVSPPEALRDPFVDEFEPLCRYMGFPHNMTDLLSGSTIERLFDMWSVAIPADASLRAKLVQQPVEPNLLVSLPNDFSDVIQMAAMFRCPTVPIEETATNIPTLCLVCGTILCSQSYCCQKTVGKETVGACRHHMITCSGPMGAFLRIRDCSIILMTTRQRGCFRFAPYVDEFGEADQGFRRGNPLHLNKDLYQKLRQLWLSQGITEEVVNQYEIDHRNMQYDWAHF